MSEVKADVAGHDGSVRVRSRGSFEAKQKIPYFLGISGNTAGARHLSLNLVVVPPHASAEPHTHSEFESAVYVISGRAIHHWGDSLQFTLETNPGDFVFIAPGVPHYPENPYDEPVVAVVARNDPDEQEHVVPYGATR
jgi:uncharacterized RmlC-like cupin family protein